MKQLFIILTLLTSCAIPIPRNAPKRYTSKEEKIMDCFKFIKGFGTSNEYAGGFCRKIYKDFK